MGKAIVIKGLEVQNPLGVVTLVNKPSDVILKDYLLRNSSISDQEKNALTAFVNSLSENNLWSKFRYFYPMLGNNVDDMTLEVIDQNNEDLFFTTGKDGLSVVDRTLTATSRNTGTIGGLAKMQTISVNNIGITLCGTCTSDYAAWQGVNLYTNNNKTIGVQLRGAFNDSDASLYNEYINKSAKGIYFDNTICKNTNVSNVPKRTMMLNVVDGLATLTLNGNDYGSFNSKQADSIVVAKTNGFLSNTRTNSSKFTFLAITEGMTTEECSIYNSLLTTFLTNVGK